MTTDKTQLAKDFETLASEDLPPRVFRASERIRQALETAETRATELHGMLQRLCDAIGAELNDDMTPEQAATFAVYMEAAQMLERVMSDKTNPPTSSESLPSGQVAEDEATIFAALRCERRNPEQCSTCAALSRLAAKAQGCEAMKVERDALRARAWVQCTTVSNACLGGCRSMKEHDQYREGMRHRALLDELENLRPLAVLHEDMTRLKQEAEAERDASVADNAALLSHIRALLDALWGPDVERQAVEIAVRRAIAKPSPGAALLADHAKASVRARNEGREEAVEAVKWCAEWGSWALNDLIARIRAKKEPEL